MTLGGLDMSPALMHAAMAATLASGACAHACCAANSRYVMTPAGHEAALHLHALMCMQSRPAALTPVPATLQMTNHALTHS